MKRTNTRRALLAAGLGVGITGASFSPARSYIDRFAPLSGRAWESARTDRRSEVESPYGPATVRYDAGVPNVTADDEAALYFAVGYVHGSDRLFQMDVQRRLMRGELAAIAGEAAFESDRFHRQLYFREAAKATVDHLLEVGEAAFVTAGEAYVEGVNRALELEPLPFECQLLTYEPEPWTFTDAILIEKLIGWGLTGSVRTLRKALVRERFDDTLAEQLYPTRFEGATPIIREFHNAGPFGIDEQADTNERAISQTRRSRSVPKQLVDRFVRFETPPAVGSNSWLIGPDLTANGAPIVSNDPHLQLQAPPVWYEMNLDGPNHRVRGVTFPGVPFVVIGENDHGAWGFTNSGADTIDFYTYETEANGQRYVYGDESRAFQVDEQIIDIADARPVTIETKRSVHGPVVEEAEREVGVAWTGHAATESAIGMYDLSHSTGVEQAREAIRKQDVPSQNFVYADRDGNTLYQLTGRLPIRRIDGEPVAGDRIFDGSAREGEWEGFAPFERPAWEGFVPFEDLPHVDNPDYLATANQQIVPDEQVGYYLADGYASPYRGARIYGLLEELLETDQVFDLEAMESIATDTYDGRAAALVEPLVQAARDSDDGELLAAANRLADWDFRMDPDSAPALLFHVWMDEYRAAIFDEPFEQADLGSAYYPSHGAIEQLPTDSAWFGPGGRAPVMREALRVALDRLRDESLDVYGDLAHTGVINHPLGIDFLGYPEIPRGGSGDTVWNFSPSGPWGSSWAMHVDLDGDFRALLAGGNDGRYFSDQYDDSIERWAHGDFRTLSREIEGDIAIQFREGSER